MILAPLAGAALIVSVVATPMIDLNAGAPMSPQQKSAAMQPLLRSATECIARSVNDDPRLRQPHTDLGDLIVESMSTCMPHVRAMIAAHDRFFGDGSGEAFFLGPYLDVLPTAVSRWVKDTPR